MENVKERYDEVIRQYLSLNAGAPLPFDKPLRELGLNSLKSVELLLDLEAAFDVGFPDSALTDENFHNAATLLEVLLEILDGRSPVVVND